MAENGLKRVFFQIELSLSFFVVYFNKRPYVFVQLAALVEVVMLYLTTHNSDSCKYNFVEFAHVVFLLKL